MKSYKFKIGDKVRLNTNKDWGDIGITLSEYPCTIDQEDKRAILNITGDVTQVKRAYEGENKFHKNCCNIEAYYKGSLIQFWTIPESYLILLKED